MGEFTDYCQATFPANGRNYMTETAEKMQDKTVKEVAVLAQRISANPSLVPSEAQVRTLVEAFGSVDDCYPNGYRINFSRIDQNLSWCFDKERGKFPDLAEQPVVAAMAMVGSCASSMAAFGLARFSNVDAERVATEMGVMFGKTPKEAYFCFEGCSHAYPFTTGSLSAAILRDMLPEQDTRERFVRDCLKQTIGAYEANPTEETKLLLRRGQNVVGALLRHPEEFTPDTLMQAVNYATKYGCPDLAHALKEITDNPKLIANGTVPSLLPEAVEDTIRRYEKDYKYRDNSPSNILHMLRYVSTDQRPELIRTALPRADEGIVAILSAASSELLLALIQRDTMPTS